MKRVLLGFSGGMDSCRAAEILQAQGYSVTALYLDMCDSTTAHEGGIRRNTYNAREVAHGKAESMGMPFRALDVRERFRRSVINYFTAEYLAGRTPAPCTICNREIKWQILSEIAACDGLDHIATGHYFNIERHAGKFYVTKAADPLKDQSYYLWALGQEVLSRALTPMGGEIKSALTPPAAYKESMGVCFLGGRTVADFLRTECDKRGEAIHEGDVVDRNGCVIGRHRGVPYYTIGQKRGLNIPAGMCVVAVDTIRNHLVAGCDADLYHHNLILSDCNIVDPEEVFAARDITVKIRGIGRNPLKPCTITPCKEGLHLTLDDPSWSSAAGQPAVLYRGNRVVGGGFLERYF